MSRNSNCEQGSLPTDEGTCIILERKFSVSFSKKLTKKERMIGLIQLESDKSSGNYC